MCVTVGRVERVSNTMIFVAAVDKDEQITCYQNKIQFHDSEDVQAMILPFPAGKPLRFINTDFGIDTAQVKAEDRPSFKLAKHLNRIVFPKDKLQKKSKGIGMGLSRGGGGRSDMLEIQHCGDLEFVVALTCDDLTRIPTKQLNLSKADDVLAFLHTNYPANFSFLCCRFMTKTPGMPPLAYVSSRLKDGRLFVPTLHYHGHEEAADEAKTVHPSIPTGMVSLGRGKPSKTEAKKKKDHPLWDHQLFTINASFQCPIEAVSACQINTRDYPLEDDDLHEQGTRSGLDPNLGTGHASAQVTGQDSTYPDWIQLQAEPRLCSRSGGHAVSRARSTHSKELHLDQGRIQVRFVIQ